MDAGFENATELRALANGSKYFLGCGGPPKDELTPSNLRLPNRSLFIGGVALHGRANIQSQVLRYSAVQVA